jgi:hypothetical protein
MSFARQWQRCDAAGAACVDVVGATAAEYPLTEADLGHTIRVRVAATNSAGSASATSDPTAVVEAPPSNTLLPALSAAAYEVGRPVTTGAGSWKGTTPMSFAYQWFHCNAAGGACAAIAGATAPTYELDATTAGRTVRALVTASNSAGQAWAASPPSAVVRFPPATVAIDLPTRPGLARRLRVRLELGNVKGFELRIVLPRRRAARLGLGNGEPVVVGRARRNAGDGTVRLRVWLARSFRRAMKEAAADQRLKVRVLAESRNGADVRRSRAFELGV